MRPASRRRPPEAAPAQVKRPQSVARRYERFFAESAAPIAVVGFDGYVIDANAAFARALSTTLEDLRRTPWTTRAHTDDVTAALRAARKVIRGRSATDVETRFRAGDGAYRSVLWTATPDEGRRCAFVVARLQDNAGAHRHVGGPAPDQQPRLQTIGQDVAFFARHDALTGLANRELAVDRLEQAMYVAQRHRRHAAVIALNLDRFKVVNESLGHAVGDELLRAVGGRLTSAARDGDTVARLGADTFLVVLADVADAGHVATIVDRLMNAVGAPYTIGAFDLVVTFSAGISAYPSDGEDSTSLLKHAEAAMFSVKAAGGAASQFSKRELQFAAIERLSLEQGLRKAIERGQLLLQYQPIVDMASGAIAGAEALVRWQHPDLGLLAPDRFIPLAEDTGLIAPLGEWVLQQACTDASAWSARGATIDLSVNISARQFRDQRLADVVSRLLEEHRLEPARLELEITESAIMRDAESADDNLGALKGLGVKLSVDDFGTGYSSLSYLRRLPLDTLKIDRTFVRDLIENSRDQAIARTIVTLGRHLGLRVVAEGVEKHDQAQLLHGFGCDLGQGFYYSRPVSAARLEQLLQRAD